MKKKLAIEIGAPSQADLISSVHQSENFLPSMSVGPMKTFAPLSFPTTFEGGCGVDLNFPTTTTVPQLEAMSFGTQDGHFQMQLSDSRPMQLHNAVPTMFQSVASTQLHNVASTHHLIIPESDSYSLVVIKSDGRCRSHKSESNTNHGSDPDVFGIESEKGRANKMKKDCHRGVGRGGVDRKEME
ncbi:unnamed protein product [Malus baccata var. baccata]